METLHIIDDDEDLLFAWKNLFEKEGYIVYTYESEKQFNKNYINKGVEVIIIDLDLDNESGIEVFKKFNQKGIFSPVILSSGYLEVGSTEEFLCNGGFRIYHKGVEHRLSFLKKIRLAIKSSQQNMELNLSKSKFYTGFNKLTAKQKDVFKLMLEGETVASSAHKLSILEGTISAHRTEIFKKVGIESVNDLKLFCTQIKFIAK